jgi:hypothetical protein
MNDRPATPLAKEADDKPRVTYGDLWKIADSERIRHTAWANVAAIRASETSAADAEGIAMQRGIAAEHIFKASAFERLQKIIGWCEASAIIKGEFIRLAAHEHSDQAASAERVTDHVEG